MPSGAAGRLAYLLKLIADGPQTFSLGQLTERSKLPTSTVHRLLQELVRSGLVERCPGQAYRPGRDLYLLASRLISQFDLTRCARPFLEELMKNWQETVVLCAYSPTDLNAVIADVVQTPNPFRYAVTVGGVIELPWGSLGRAILAHLPEDERKEVFGLQKVGPITGRPLPPPAEMEADLAMIREQGHSRFHDPENDLSGIASPIFGRDDEVLGCVGVTMPAKRYSLHSEDSLAQAVRDAALRVSERARIAQT
ncbi:MAG TPA: IclR family transcriptional regulator [Sphingomonadaceae bacterium]|nr:IclR family transcriptional regulator [Sphingomonadaceae bacterium]